jgi:hypothetical protein
MLKKQKNKPTEQTNCDSCINVSQNCKMFFEEIFKKFSARTIRVGSFDSQVGLGVQQGRDGRGRVEGWKDGEKTLSEPGKGDAPYPEPAPLFHPAPSPSQSAG